MARKEVNVEGLPARRGQRFLLIKTKKKNKFVVAKLRRVT